MKNAKKSGRRKDRLELLTLLSIILMFFNPGRLSAVNCIPADMNEADLQEIPQSLMTLISVDFQSMPIEQALMVVAEKGGFKLNYKMSCLPLGKKITLRMSREPAIQVMKTILHDTEAELKIVKGGHCVILPKEKKRNLLGTIYGKVEESRIPRAIPGVSVQSIQNSFSTVSDEKGEFRIFNVSPGSYSLQFSSAGFETLLRTDVIVRPGRITVVNVKMEEQIFDLSETVEVSGSYIYKAEHAATSSVNISAEEIRRTPGSAGFLDRMLPILPGIAQRRDGTADLMIRGGGPAENAFYIDNIEVPYISHVPTIGSTGGKFSSIHPDLVQHVDFFSGAFSSDYGGRLSSVTDISFREGNRYDFDGQVDSNLLLSGVVLEGPLGKLGGSKGSWLVSARSSYTQLLEKLGLLDETAPLKTSDFVAKLTYDLSTKHKLGFLDFLSSGFFQDDHGFSVEDRKYTQNVLGFNLRSIWADNFFSNTTLSYSFFKRSDKETYQSYTIGDYKGQYYWEAPDTTKFFVLRNSNSLNFSRTEWLEFGAEIKHEKEKIDYYGHEYHDDKGELHPPQEYDFDYQTTKSALFLTLETNLFERFSSRMGLRAGYSSAQKAFHLSPRISFSFQLSPRFSLNAGFGIFYQTIPMRLQAIFPRHRLLDDMKAAHYILGLEYIDAGTKITLEAYSKKYRNLLIDPAAPYALASGFAIEEYYYPSVLTNAGRGYVNGIELLIHKKLVNRLFGLISATVHRSRYQDLDGIWRRSPYEHRYIFNMVAGYKPNAKWELALSSTFMSGRPCSPFDLDASRFHNTLVVNPDISKYNTSNYPAYKRINFRVERKYYFGKTNFIVFLDIMNVFGFKNPEDYDWDQMTKTVIPDEGQMPFLPILGLKLEF